MCVHALVSLPGMGKAKFRTLKELYHSTEQGSVPTQSFKFEMEEKSRSRNLCATWCSWCMHFERVAATVGVGTDDFTDKTFEEKRTGQCSSNGAVLFSPSLSTACDCRQHTSSEASNIFSVSSSHDSFSENAESKFTFRDSDSYKDIESLLNIRKAQSCRESGDTPKGLTNFDDQRFSNQLEKHKELEILGDNTLSISRSESANLAIGIHNGGPDRKNVSCRSASDDSFPVVEKDVNERLVYLFVAGTHFDEANGNQRDAENFAEESPLARVVIPNRSDQSDISSLKDFYDCAILEKREPSECSSEQVESSIARATLSGLGRIDGVYSRATFVGADPHLNCFETKSHSYCKKHPQKSVAVINNTSMQESWQTQQAKPRGVLDLMDDEVRVCDTCGDAGQEQLLAICNKCTDGAEHTYCMRVKLQKVPKADWMCEECMLRSDTEKLLQCKVEEAARIPKCQKSESWVNLESRSSSKLKFRSAYAWKSGTEGVSSLSHLSAKRHGVPLEAQSVKTVRIEMSDVPPRSSKPCNNSILHRDFSCKNFNNGKVKATKDITSVLQISCNSQEKPKVLRARGDKRHGGTLKAELDKKRRALETRVILPKASKSSNQSLLSREPPFKKLGKEKLEAAAHSVSSVKQSSYGTEEKAKLSSRLGDESPKLGSETEIAHDKCSLLKSRSSKAADLKFKGQLAKGGCLQKRKAERNLAFHDTRKEKNLRMVSKSMSFNSVTSDKSNATCSILANAYCPVDLKNSSSAEETKTAKGKDASELHNPAMCLLASDSGVTAVKSGKKAISRDETFFAGSNCCELDAVQSSGQLDYRLQPSSHNAHKDLNCPNEEKKNESWQAERSTETATAMKLHKLCTGLASDERSQFEAAILSECFVMPKPDYIWLGKFQIHSGEAIASTCDGFQAHLSTCASCKVLEVVDRLPEIIILEELPRLRMWPSQFMESQASEEDIALYFFAKDLDSYSTYYMRLMEYMTKNDLALKGNLDGVELLIFPSNVLPEKSQRWNELLFLWGVFRGRKVNNSANTPVSNSQKLENRDIVRSCTLDLNAYPQDGNDMVRVYEIGKFDSIGTRPLEDTVLLGGDSYNSGCSDSSQALKGEKKSQSAVLDLDLSLWPKSATPRDGPRVSVGTADDKTNKEVHGKLPMEEKHNADNVEVHGKFPMDDKNNADNVEVHGKLPMDEKNNADNVEVHGKLPMDERNNADNVEPSRPPSVSVASPTIYEENLDPLVRQVVGTLLLLSKGLRKIYVLNGAPCE